jgi:hypothetical protein
MKKLLTIAIMCILLFGILKQSEGQNMANQQISKIEKQVDSVFHSMIKTAEKLDYDKLSKGVDDRNNAGFIVNGTYYSEYDVLANLLKANVQDGSKQSITITKEKITVLTERIVLITASGNANVQINSNQSFTSNFLWSFVYEKIGDEWKVIQSHQSQAN